MDISDWRKKIDELDIEIVRLINQRAEAARAIGEIKKTADLPVYEPKREQEVFDRVRSSTVFVMITQYRAGRSALPPMVPGWTTE